MKGSIFKMKFVCPRQIHPRYFEKQDGSTCLPVGLNLCFFRNSENRPEAEVLETFRFWMTEFARNGGNFVRICLGVPFSAGSAGCGQAWHRDHICIQNHHLHWHYARFARAVEGIDPVKEKFVPYHTETRRLRLHGLRGKEDTLLWCRDKRKSRRREPVGQIAPEVLHGERISVDGCGECSCSLPREDRERALPEKDV